MTDDPYDFDVSVIVPDTIAKPSVELVQPAVKRTVDSKVQKPDLPKTFSIKKAIATPLPNPPSNQTQMAAEEEQPIEVAESKPAEQVTNLSQTELSSLIAEFTASCLTDRPMYSGLISGSSVLLTEGGQAVAQFDSQLQIDMFQDIKAELIQYLRDRLASRQFDIVEQVANAQDEGEKTKPKLFTAEDKFKFMIQKKPELFKLKQRFNLDL